MTGPARGVATGTRASGAVGTAAGTAAGTGTTTAGGGRAAAVEVPRTAGVAAGGITSPRGRRETETAVGTETGIGGERYRSILSFLKGLPFTQSCISHSRHHREKSPHRNSSSKRDERDNRSSTIRETSLFAEMIKKKNLRDKLTEVNRRAEHRGDVNQHGAPPTAPAAAAENNAYNDHHRYGGKFRLQFLFKTLMSESFASISRERICTSSPQIESPSRSSTPTSEPQRQRKRRP